MPDEHGVEASEVSGGGVSYAPAKGGWTPEQREKFKRTMRKKKRALEAEQQQKAAANNGQAGEVSTAKEDLPHVLACPRCGLNMKAISIAIAFSDKQSIINLGAENFTT